MLRNSMSDELIRLREVFVDVFQDDEITIGPETTTADIEEWDSLMHVTLMLSVEKAFKIRFGAADVVSLKNVGDLVQLIRSKVKA